MRVMAVVVIIVGFVLAIIGLVIELIHRKDYPKDGWWPQQMREYVGSDMWGGRHYRTRIVYYHPLFAIGNILMIVGVAMLVLAS